MSRGPGRVQQTILDLLECPYGIAYTYRELADHVYGPRQAYWQRDEIGRACRRLEQEGKVTIRDGCDMRLPDMVSPLVPQRILLGTKLNLRTHMMERAGEALSQGRPTCFVWREPPPWRPSKRLPHMRVPSTDQGPVHRRRK